MVHAAIINENCKLNEIFCSINNIQNEYNWLVTNCECFSPSYETENLLNKEYCWLSGNKLSSILNTDGFSCIWAVLSGFKKDIPLEHILEYPLPYANGYSGFWKNPISIQHPLAEIEIVAWDGISTLLFAKEQNIVNSFRNAFPLSEDLTSYNLK